MAPAKKVLTKGQIVTHFAGKFGIPKKVAASVIEEYAALAIAETKKKGAFVLSGIGKSVLVKRKARKGRNPQTGKEIKIPAKTVVKIRPAKAFKEGIVPSKK
jgi:DNA-binding protein HU-beta